MVISYRPAHVTVIFLPGEVERGYLPSLSLLHAQVDMTRAQPPLVCMRIRVAS